MEILNSFLKDLDNVHKITIALIIIVLWPISSALMFLCNAPLFINLDTLKLSLLSMSFSMPMALINSVSLYFILRPLNHQLREQRPVENPVAGSLLLGVAVTILIVSFVAMATYFLNLSSFIVAIMILVTEIVWLLIAAITIWREKMTETDGGQPNNF